MKYKALVVLVCLALLGFGGIKLAEIDQQAPEVKGELMRSSERVIKDIGFDREEWMGPQELSSLSVNFMDGGHADLAPKNEGPERVEVEPCKTSADNKTKLVTEWRPLYKEYPFGIKRKIGVVQIHRVYGAQSPSEDPFYFPE